MLTWLEQFLVRYPELALFLVIAAGYWIGSFKIGTFSLGPVTGALFAGLAVGDFAHVPVSSMTKSFLFLLFLFGVGYLVGPQFAQSMKRDGLKPMLLAIVVCLTGLATSIAVAKVLRLDPGYASGLMSGALSQSAAMGTATDAINGLAIPEAQRALFVSHIAVADAVCYIFGYAGVILFVTQIAPALLKIDLPAEALKLEQALGVTRTKPGLASAWRKFELRAYRLDERSALVGVTVAAAEARIPDYRLFIHRIRRGEHLLEADPSTVLAAGDLVALSAPRQVIVEWIGPRAEEVEDRELLDIPLITADVILINPKLAGVTLEAAARESWARALYLRSLRRGDQEIPVGTDVVLQRGDLLRIVGPEPVVQSAAKSIGVIVAPSTSIDFIVLGLAIFLGGLVGTLLSFSVGGINISLSTSVGTLLAGLLVGYLRTIYPLFGQIPDGAISLMTSLGLAAFVGLTGIHAGPIFLSALRETGLSLLLGGMAVTLLPQIVGFCFGHFVLRMNPILLLGSLTGAQTVTAAMAALQERAGSPVPVLGYTPAYPVANILLTTWGSVMVVVFAT
ncbi:MULTISPECIES: aspartate-alanine antiporter [Bradyrhizobium]|jgi:putative transport protein|uniref:aspartate-alanine antiporter n=2 Tax=Bradyrhizobium TaxID=374 RepID=UPI0004B045FA|nr:MULTISPECIES: aspartate-alanine antiporter [Bradyrhizobium]MBR0947753.1 aspartate-alanine antiporter [Bradyrhizobium liaoningense]MBR1028169.1 aspartate-alanine antiporter [Bradyrhizobium liaoningense]MDI2071053.1 aspartate-alanine antiporter [Bradyrhizobium sp. Mp27]